MNGEVIKEDAKILVLCFLAPCLIGCWGNLCEC